VCANHPLPHSADHSPREPIVEEYQAALRDTTRLTRLFTILSEPSSMEVVLDRSLSTLSEVFSSDVVALLKAGNAESFVVVKAIGLPEELLQKPLSGSASSYTLRVKQSRAPVTVSLAREDPRVDRHLRDLDLDCAVWLPVLGSQEMEGVLMLARCRAEPFQARDVDLLMAMAYRIGLVVERARVEQERKSLEERLLRAEKAESLSRMAGAIAHEFNNIFSAILASLDLARESLPHGHEAHVDLARALEATRKAAGVSGHMLAYLGQGLQARSSVDLVVECREALAALKPTLPARIDLRSEFPPQLLPVKANAAQVRQILNNLVTNSAEAIETAGKIVITLRVLGAGEVTPSPLLSPGFAATADKYACIEVADDGCGMDRKTLHNAFDPFFTTKFAGRGLGLPVVQGTVRAHEGAIALASEPGLGTTVRVFLPLLEASAANLDTAVASNPSAIGHGLVLVVDDDPMILGTTRRMLSRMGYEVITADDGLEAVELFRTRMEGLRFVLLDLTMPRMDGWQALTAMRTLRPGVPAILASGYDESQVMGGDHGERPQTFLQKPYAWEELKAAVTKALAPSPIPGADIARARPSGALAL